MANSSFKQEDKAESNSKHKLEELKTKLRGLNKKLQLDINVMSVKFSKNEDHREVLLGTVAIQEMLKLASRLKSSIKHEERIYTELKRRNDKQRSTNLQQP